ncbi:MAG: MMPL family transporter [Dehalococcoidia bacterium]|nr:MMPL family transporter [Dehalococcoidia bacterium]
MVLGSLARCSARRPWVIVALWAVVMLAAFGVIGLLWEGSFTSESVLFDGSEYNVGEEILEERFRGPRPATEVVVVHSDTYTIVDPEFEATVQNLFFGLAALAPGVVSGVSQYYNSGSDWQVSDDGHSTIISVTMSGTLDEAAENISELMSVVRRHNGQDDFEVLLVGEASVAARIAESATRLYLASQTIGFGNAAYYIAFIGLLGIGALAGMRLPVVLSLPMVAIPSAIMALIGMLFPVHAIAANLLVLIAALLGLVFTVLIALRYREERHRGFHNLDAIERTCSTVGMAIAFGVLIAVIGLAGLLIVPSNLVVSVGLGAILALCVPLVGAVTLTPALLTLRYDRVTNSRAAEQDDAEEVVGASYDGRGRLSRMLDWIVDVAMNRPVLSSLAAIAILVALSLPVLDLTLGFNSPETIPNRHDNRAAYGPQHYEAFTRLAENFPVGAMSPVEVVIDAPFVDPDVEARVADLQAGLIFAPDLSGQTFVQTNLDRDVVLISSPTISHPESESAIGAVRSLRDEPLPDVFGDTDIVAVVTGRSAFAADLLHLVESYTPVVVALVIVSSLLILLVGTRSLAVPVLLTVLNMFSAGAALGVMALLFQNGGGTADGVLVTEAWLPMLIVPLLFGLLMASQLVLLGRIRELLGNSGEYTESIAAGMSGTVVPVTLMSLVMAAVFGNLVLEIFGWRLFPFHQLGVAMAVGLVLNAVVVQLVLLPATLKLLGSAAWYFPKSLKWLPDLSVAPQSLQR